MMSPKLTDHLKENPVVITGMGAFSGAGAGSDLLWTSAANGVSLARWLPPQRSPGAGRLAGCQAPPVNTTAPVLHTARRMDRSVQMAVTAAAQAWMDAGLDRHDLDPGRISVVAGTSRGPADKWAESMERLAKGRVLPTAAANCTIAGLSGALAMLCQAEGPCFTVSSACSSSASAIALGAQQILLGTADVVLVGGAEAPLTANVLAQLDAAGVLGFHEDPVQTCRPFDAARNGTVLGEGAAFLVLESLASARKRGAKIHGELAGWAIGNETGERTGMGEDGGGLMRVMEQALQLAQLSPHQIDYINAHGTGTPLNDRMEARALARVFANIERPVPCSSTKPVTGHCMGAAAALEAVICLKALQHQVTPPTVNCHQPDVSSNIQLIRDTAQPCKLRAIMSNSSGFWGNHASLVFAVARNV